MPTNPSTETAEWFYYAHRGPYLVTLDFANCDQWVEELGTLGERSLVQAQRAYRKRLDNA